MKTIREISFNNGINPEVGEKILAEYLAQQEPMPPIERDEEMDRTYIPVHPNWEIQTKGTGSSFRIAKRDESGDRWLVCDSHLHAMLEEMARDIHRFLATPIHAGMQLVPKPLVNDLISALNESADGEFARLPLADELNGFAAMLTAAKEK